jgi:hypothetical protein
MAAAEGNGLPQEIFSLEFRNRRDGRTLRARFFMPTRQSVDARIAGKTAYYWVCRFEVQRNGKVSNEIASGDNWLQALLMAVEGVRRTIPDDSEQDWQTEDGIPSWVLLPKHVTISWGYELHRKLWDMVRSGEEEHLRNLRKADKR